MSYICSIGDKSGDEDHDIRLILATTKISIVKQQQGFLGNV